MLFRPLQPAKSKKNMTVTISLLIIELGIFIYNSVIEFKKFFSYIFQYSTSRFLTLKYYCIKKNINLARSNELCLFFLS